MTWLFAFALAADLASFPFVAPVDLPAEGPVRLVLSGDALGSDPRLTRAGAYLVDAAGVDVPYAILPPDGMTPERESLFRRPVGAYTWETQEADRLLEAIEVHFDDLESKGPFRVWVDVFGSDGWVADREPDILYRWTDASGAVWEDERVEIPTSRGPFRVRAETLGTRSPDLEYVQGLLLFPERVPPLVESFDPGPGIHLEDGRVRYLIQLPGPRFVTAVKFDVEGDVFERRVYIGAVLPDGRVVAENERTLRRVELGGARIDLTRAESLDLATDTLVVEIEVNRDRPLDVTTIHVESPAVQLVARNAGPGPHLLYLGGRDANPAYDLGVGALELARLAPERLSPGVVGPNPAYLPLPTREGVDAPGGVVNLARFRWSRAIEASPGWVRLPLDTAVSIHARTDRGDLRVVDAQGRQVPYFLRPSAVSTPWETGALVREEDLAARATYLRLPLGAEGPPVEAVTLTTSALTFEREVSVLRDRGRQTETVRRVTWNGLDRGRSLTLQLGEPMGRELLLRIDNGDNPPMPISAVTVTSAAWELAFRMPEGGARLFYGAPDEEMPGYDLSLLSVEAEQIPLGPATLGVEQAAGGPALSAFDRFVVVGAVGALALGLLALLIRVLRATAEPELAPDASQRSAVAHSRLGCVAEDIGALVSIGPSARRRGMLEVVLRYRCSNDCAGRVNATSRRPTPRWMSPASPACSLATSLDASPATSPVSDSPAQASGA